jgi:hypothetical protein
VHGLRSLGLAGAWLALTVGSGGCSAGSEQTICDQNGCQVCDAYGCRGAEPKAETVCDPTVSTCTCTSVTQCKNGLQCIDGLCLTACQYSSECGAGRVCLNGKCLVGCDAKTPCPSGYSCSAKGVCDPDAVNPLCSDAKPCVGGLKCVKGICQGGCKLKSDCAPTEICDPASGTCATDPQPKPACATDPSVCGTTQVCKNGYCRYPCTDSDACSKIDVRISECKTGICMSTAEANPKCTQKSDCAPVQDCVSNICL